MTVPLSIRFHVPLRRAEVAENGTSLKEANERAIRVALENAGAAWQLDWLRLGSAH
jgi:hypothetical protein